MSKTMTNLLRAIILTSFLLVTILSPAMEDSALDDSLAQSYSMLEREAYLKNRVRYNRDENGAIASPSREEYNEYSTLIQNRRQKYRTQRNHVCHSDPEGLDCAFADNGLIQPNPRLLTPEEIELLLSLKAHVVGLVQAQNLEIKKRIECLSIDQIKDVSLMRSERPDFAKDCKNLRIHDVMDFFKEYKKMKVALALSQAVLGLSPIDPSSFNYKLRHLPDWPNPTKYNQNYNGVWCNIYRYPLGFDDTTFCTNNIYNLFDPFPKHIGIQYQWQEVNKLLEYTGLYTEIPEIVELEPLTLTEIGTAASEYREAYLIGTRRSKKYKHLNPKLTSNDDTQEAIREQNERDYLRYLSASKLSGNNWDNSVFQEDLEMSSSFKETYAKTIIENPFFVFLDLPTKDVSVDCEKPYQRGDLLVDFKELCKVWMVELEKQNLKPQVYDIYEKNSDGMWTNRPLRFALKAALEKSLETNKILMARINEEFNTPELIKGLKPGAQFNESLVQKWMPLMAFETAMENLLKIHPEFDDHRTRLQKMYEESEMIKGVTEMGLAVAAGLSCGAIILIAKIPTPLCIVATGLGVNSYFYATAYSNYQEQFIEYFSSPNAELALIDLELVDSADQGMLWEAGFFFIGTGAGQFVKKLGSPMREALNRYKQQYNYATKFLANKGLNQ